MYNRKKFLKLSGGAAFGLFAAPSYSHPVILQTIKKLSPALTLPAKLQPILMQAWREFPHSGYSSTH